MPIYNERRTLRKVFERLLSANIPIDIEVVAVDDHSTDGSADILRELAAADPRIKPIFHEKNAGKGAAIHTAIKHISGDIAIVQDADLEYDPAEIPKIIQPILDGRADAVFGSRFAGSDCRRVLYYWHSVANGVLTWITNCLCDLNLTDMETCYKAVSASILRSIPLRFKSFGFEPELTVRLAQWQARIYEVPVSYSGRTYAEGKKITWKDGVIALAVLFWTAIVDRRFTTHDGYYVLTAVRGPGLNRWMFECISPFVGSHVLEAGCGIGNLTELMLDREDLTCVDIDPLYVEIISRRFSHLENFDCFRMDLSDSKDFVRLEGKGLDTIICLNVLEHIENDEQVLRNFADSLVDGGHAIILVPQHAWLYTPIDEAVGHCRRYSGEELRQKMVKAGFEIVSQQNFNKLGVLGWIVNGKIMRRKHLSSHQMWCFNKLLPIARLLDTVPGLPALSTIVVGRKIAKLDPVAVSV
jgi:SAM-dependent methyltransferase